MSPKCFLLVVFDRKELEQRTRYHCAQLITRFEWYAWWPWGYVEVTWPEVNLWPWPGEVIIYIFRCISMRGSDSTVTKNSVVLKYRYLDFLTPVTSFCTWPKNGFVKNVHIVRLYNVSNAVYRFSLACFVFEISGGRISAPPSVRSWPRLPSFTWHAKTVQT